MRFVLLFLFIIFSFANQSEYLYALKLYYDQNSTKNTQALKLLEQVTIEDQNADAAFLLAVAYSDGKLVEKNLDKSLYWYEVAANLGDRDAMMFAGWIYYQKKEYKKAKEWFEKAYKLGDKEALEMINLIDSLSNW